MEAFESFLTLTDYIFSFEISSPLIGLFLLICDISINPVEGFPLPIEHLEEFVGEADPGTRFGRLCSGIKNKPDICNQIKNFDRQEYLNVSSQLCGLANITHPHHGLEEIVKWPERNDKILQILTERESLNFAHANMPLRLMLSSFVSFSQDKFERPEFFCWPGMHLSGTDVRTQDRNLFQKHQSLFTNRSDKAGIFPRLMPKADPKQCVTNLNQFYQWYLIYDFTAQWILSDGPFDLHYDWLIEADAVSLYEWAEGIVMNLYNVAPDDFRILPKVDLPPLFSPDHA